MTNSSVYLSTSTGDKPKPSVFTIRLFVTMLAVATMAGCVSTGSEDTDYMPWNTPRSWEGVPALPVMPY